MKWPGRQLRDLDREHFPEAVALLKKKQKQHETITHRIDSATNKGREPLQSNIEAANELVEEAQLLIDRTRADSDIQAARDRGRFLNQVARAQDELRGLKNTALRWEAQRRK